jgi:hypothetical protein
VQVRLQNFQPEGAVPLSDQAGTLVLEDGRGRVSSIPLPPESATESVRLGLAQRRLEGELPAGHTRAGWKLMEREVDLAGVTSGEFRLGDGRVVRLQPSTEGR